MDRATVIDKLEEVVSDVQAALDDAKDNEIELDHLFFVRMAREKLQRLEENIGPVL